MAALIALIAYVHSAASSADMRKANIALPASIEQDGSWPMSLLAGENMLQPETSGTGFFTYGLAWGINNGLLSEQEFLPAAEKGWNLRSSAIHPMGNWAGCSKLEMPPARSGTGIHSFMASEHSCLQAAKSTTCRKPRENNLFLRDSAQTIMG